LKASDEGIRQLARQGVVATLLPATAFCLREPFARGRAMIDAGCAVALASDFNPGSCFTCSIPLITALACIYMHLRIEEVITALTVNGAAALGRSDSVGSLEAGKKADLLLLGCPSIRFLPYHTGINLVEMVMKDGEIVWNSHIYSGTNDLSLGTEGLSPGTEGLFLGTEGLSPGTEDLSPGTEDLFQGTEDSFQGTEGLFQGTKGLFQETEDLFQETEDLFRETEDLFPGTEGLFHETKQIGQV
jgi:hypothetical protein